MRDASPLRYPGGKWRFADFFRELLAKNFSTIPAYVEPYAGGSSLALSLLFSNSVSEIFLNDLDPAIYSFWKCVLRHNVELCELIKKTPITPCEWAKQKEAYAHGLRGGTIALGFAVFFLNRTNHSGILNGGMIGGKSQLGNWKLNARFNRTELIRRIKRIQSFRSRIHLSHQDAADFLHTPSFPKHALIYLDPPYYQKGRRLYLNAYRPEDHDAVRRTVGRLKQPWIVSYDDVPPIRKLYDQQRTRRVRLLHTARAARIGKEVLFFSHKLIIPKLELG